MLLELNVMGFGIIEEITWQPTGGLNVITGETGAGKSLVVDAVEALLTGQAREEDIRHGAETARIEGIFDLGDDVKGVALRNLLSEKDLQPDDGALPVTCEFHRHGRSLPRVNRQAVSRSILRDIVGRLVDIHAQSAHLSLLDNEQHLEFLDSYAHTLELRREFGGMAAELYRAEHKLEEMERAERNTSRQADLLSFQTEEIRKAALRPGEEDEATEELARLTSVEQLKAATSQVVGLVQGDDDTAGTAPVMESLRRALPLLKQATQHDRSLQPQLEQLERIVDDLSELARDVRSYGESLEHDPCRIEELQARLELIRSLKRKYGSSIEEVMLFLARAEKELEGLSGSGERRAELSGVIERTRSEMGMLASQLSEDRAQAARRLAASVKRELDDLGMSGVEFDVSVTREPAADGLPFPDGERYRFSSTGADTVEFMASTNPGEPPKPLSRIASTGEISRFMLALKAALAEADTVPVLIFDEIDIGVGGRSGEVIGRKLWQLSRSHQVICVTHLPQIAAFADAHFHVSKKIAGERTVSAMAILHGESRLEELALMLAGHRDNTSSLAAAELLRKADAWKQEISRSPRTKSGQSG